MPSKMFMRNKVANFKAAKHRTVSTNNPHIGLFCKQQVTESVNNKGLNNNPRYNPEVVAIPKHSGMNLYRGR